MNGAYCKALIALGSNLAHNGLSPATLVLEAMRHFAQAHIFVQSRSRLWRSPPWPPANDTMHGQPHYINAIVACNVSVYAPDQLVKTLQAIEAHFGRVRTARWAARTLDLDLIDLDGAVGNFDGVVLPHPRAHERAFVLAPLAEVAPDWRHPILQRSAAELLAGLPDRELTVPIADPP